MNLPVISTKKIKEFPVETIIISTVEFELEIKQITVETTEEEEKEAEKGEDDPTDDSTKKEEKKESAIRDEVILREYIRERLLAS